MTVKPSKIDMFLFDKNAPDQTMMFVARDKRGKILREFEMKKHVDKAPFVKQAFEGKMRADNSEKDFWDSWENEAKKHRM